MQTKKAFAKIKKAINQEPLIIEDNLLYSGDCLPLLKQIPDNIIRLVITDPPYNIGLKYNKYNDRLPEHEYLNNLYLVLKEIYRILKDDGSLYWVNYPELNAKTLPFIEKIGFIFKRWLTWHYPTNIGLQDRNFTRTQRSILFCTKTKKNIFNRNDIAQPYKNPNVSKVKQRIEAGSKGCAPYDYFDTHTLKETINNNSDVFNINLLKNTSRYRAGNSKIHHPCQLPITLLSIFIQASSNKGDIVLDPFAGTFTTNLAAKILSRKSIGIELDPDYIELGTQRLDHG